MIYRVEVEEYGTAWVWRPRWFFDAIAKRFQPKPLTTLGRLEYRPDFVFSWLTSQLQERLRVDVLNTATFNAVLDCTLATDRPMANNRKLEIPIKFNEAKGEEDAK